jgi:DNA invertase Pin-like site-specific DNA recombinase
MTTHRIGYARDQNLDLQRDALKKAGCDKTYEDTVSGTKSQRPGLDQALDNLRKGDTLVVWKLDRLGRSVKDLLDFAGGLNDRGVGFVSLTDAIDTTTVSGRFFSTSWLPWPRWNGSSWSNVRRPDCRLHANKAGSAAVNAS